MMYFGQEQERSASEDQQEESEKESSPTSEHEARLFDLEKDLGPTLLKYPDISTCENPIREIKISHEMLSSFICFRDLTVKDFLKLNSTFPKSNFDRCIDCWLDKMYPDNQEKVLRNNIHQILVFVRADTLMYNKSSADWKCVSCKGSSPFRRNCSEKKAI